MASSNGYATLADLLPANMNVSPNPATAGGSVTVSYTVRNQGGTAAPASRTKVQIKNSSNVLLREQTFSTVAIGANSSVNENRTMSLSGASSGTYKAYVIVDNDSDVTQSNVSNDYSSAVSFTVQSSATLADLLPANVSVSPDPATAGGSVTVSYTVRNQGGTAAPASRTKVQIKNSSNVLLREQAFSTVAIGANSSVNENRTMSLSGASSGTYKAYVIVDNDSDVTQSNVSNDYSSAVSFTVQSSATLADLLPANVSVSPDPATAGGSVTVSYTVRNQGGTAAPASQTKVQIKNSSNVLLREQTFSTVAIGANSSVNENRTMSLSGASSGTYKAYVIVDNDSDVTQSNVSNDYSPAISFSVEGGSSTVWGSVIGSYNGVENYSNSTTGMPDPQPYNSGAGINTGLKWECVEYVNRYYWSIYSVDLRSRAQANASSYFNLASSFGLSAIVNGSTQAPQSGDILCFDGGPSGFGHVAIVKSVDTSSQKIWTIQQNVLNGRVGSDGVSTDENYCYTYTESGGGYTVSGARLGSTYSCEGWLRNPNIPSIPTLSVIPSNRIVSAALAGSTQFTVSNSGTGSFTYTAEVDPADTWLQITGGPTGTNSGVITIHYDAYSGTERVGHIRVTASGASDSPQIVTVTQQGSSTGDPTPQEVSDYAAQLSTQYKVPSIIIKAFLEQESSWRQTVTHPEPDGRIGYGISQVTVSSTPNAQTQSLGKIVENSPQGSNPFTTTRENVTIYVDQLEADWRYNAEIGVRILVAKKVESGGAGDDARILENWYYPLAYYNGATKYPNDSELNPGNDPSRPTYSRNPVTNEQWKNRLVFPYQECVYNIIAQLYTPPASHLPYYGTPIKVTLPGPAAVGSGAGHYLYVEPIFCFWDWAMYYEDGTVRTGPWGTGNNGCIASRITHSGIPVHIENFSQPSTSFTFTNLSTVEMLSFPVQPSQTFAQIFGSNLIGYIYCPPSGTKLLDIGDNNVVPTAKTGYLVLLNNPVSSLTVTGSAVSPGFTLSRDIGMFGVTQDNVRVNSAATIVPNCITTLNGLLDIWPSVDSGQSFFDQNLIRGKGYLVIANSSPTTLVVRSGAMPAQAEVSSAAKSQKSVPVADVQVAGVGTDFSCPLTISQSGGAGGNELAFGVRSSASNVTFGINHVLQLMPWYAYGALNTSVDPSHPQGFREVYHAPADDLSWTVFVHSAEVLGGSPNTNPVVLSWTIPSSGVDPQTKFELLNESGNVIVSDMRTQSSCTLPISGSHIEMQLSIHAYLPSNPVVPVVNPIHDVAVQSAVAYTGPTPSLSQGSLPVTWSLVVGPSGMTINPGTGVVSWPNPASSGSPHSVTIRATNAYGQDEESWTLTVNSNPVAPQIGSIADHSVSAGSAYTGPNPTLSAGTLPITWSLLSAPAGMTIDSSTGVVSWPSPTIVGSPHTVTIQAVNSVGADDESWQLTVNSTTVTDYILQPGPEGKDTFYGTVYVQQGDPDNKEMKYGGWGDYYYDLIEFDLSQAPAASDNVQAELHLYVTGLAANDPNLRIERVTVPWEEASVSLANNPSAVDFQAFGTLQDGWNIVDITDLYKGWKDGTYPNYGIRLNPTANDQTNGHFASSDHQDSSIRPKLVVKGGESPTCHYSLSPTSFPIFPAVGGTGSFGVSADAGCAWAAVSESSWLTILSGSGSGSGTVSYSVSSNSSTSQRNAAITVQGQTHTVTQLGSTGPQGPPNDAFANRITIYDSQIRVSSYTVDATKESGEPNHAGNSGGKSVWWSWTAPESGSVMFSTDGDYDTLLAVYTGEAIGSLTEIVSNNDRESGDSTSLVVFEAVSGENYKIAVDGYGGAGGNLILDKTCFPCDCEYMITPAQANISADGGSGAVEVSGNPGCTWTVECGSSWVTFTSGVSGIGSSTVSYVVSPNTGVAPRTADLWVKGQRHTITQLGVGSSGEIPVVFTTSYEDCTAQRTYPPSGYTERGSIHLGLWRCNDLYGTDFYGTPLFSGWLAMAYAPGVSEPPVIFSTVYDDCTGHRTQLPAGYVEKGSVHVGGGCGDYYGTDYFGYAIRSGWLGMCYKDGQPNPPVLFSVVYNDCTGQRFNPPTGYTERGSIHVGYDCRDYYGSDYYGRMIKSGWLGMYYRNDYLVDAQSGAYNLFTPDKATTLSVVGAPLRNYDLGEALFKVYELSPDLTTSSLVAISDFVTIGNGEKWCMSPEMNVPLEKGKVYGVGLVWSGGAELDTLIPPGSLPSAAGDLLGSAAVPPTAGDQIADQLFFALETEGIHPLLLQFEERDSPDSAAGSSMMDPLY